MFLLSGFIGALIGVSVTLIFNIWKFHRDERTSRCDELCSAIAAAGVLASNYWANKYEDKPEQRVEEARILGSQSLIDGLYADLRSVLRKEDGAKLDEVFSDLFDHFSGGDFSVNARPTDPSRVAAATQAASIAVIEVRRSHRRTFPFAGVISAFHDNRQRELDMRPEVPLGTIRTPAAPDTFATQISDPKQA